MRDAEAFASLVALSVKSALAPVLERLAIAEAKLAAGVEQHAAVTELRERVVVVETKAAVPVSVDAVVLNRLSELESKSAVPLEKVFAPELSELPTLRASLASLEMRLAVMDAKMAAVNPLEPAVEKFERQVAELLRDVGALRERVAVAEVRAPVPGPAGEPGPAGKDGKDGVDGRDGTLENLKAVKTDERTIRLFFKNGDPIEGGEWTFPVEVYRDVWQSGREYVKGDCVTWRGCEWHCNDTTTAKPGESKDWALKVKCGRDGKDGKDAPEPAPVVRLHG